MSDAGEELRSRQAPLKERYRGDAAAAVIVLRAAASLDAAGVACRVDTGRALVEAGLHPATGGSGLQVCSGDMLLEALVACAGVTLRAVATSLGIDVRGGRIEAEGDLDVRGTLGVSKEAPVGFRADPSPLPARHRRDAGAAGDAAQAHGALLRGAADPAGVTRAHRHHGGDLIATARRGR